MIRRTTPDRVSVALQFDFEHVKKKLHSHNEDRHSNKRLALPFDAQ